MIPIITAKQEIEKMASRGRTKRDERDKERGNDRRGGKRRRERLGRWKRLNKSDKVVHERTRGKRGKRWRRKEEKDEEREGSSR